MIEKEKYWSRFADDFEERNNYVVGKLDMKTMLNEVSKQKGLKKTLELACGNGTYSQVLAKNSDTLLATDFSEAMVELAKNKLKAFANVKVENADAFNLRSDSNSFDTVFMANLLHVVPNPEDIIVESKRILKKEGRIIILDFGMEGMSYINIIKMIYRYIKSYGKPPAQGKKLNVKSITEMLINQGFNIKVGTLIGHKMKAAFVIAMKN